jgi:hypothetical protein
VLIVYFLAGPLILIEGLKLSIFQSAKFKSKPSCLSKKMVGVKMRTARFCPVTGCVPNAEELSRPECAFVSTIPNPVEQAEVEFHMD